MQSLHFYLTDDALSYSPIFFFLIVWETLQFYLTGGAFSTPSPPHTHSRVASHTYVLNFLALLVQKYKY